MWPVDPGTPPNDLVVLRISRIHHEWIIACSKL